MGSWAADLRSEVHFALHLQLKLLRGRPRARSTGLEQTPAGFLRGGLCSRPAFRCRRPSVSWSTCFALFLWGFRG